MLDDEISIKQYPFETEKYLHDFKEYDDKSAEPSGPSTRTSVMVTRAKQLEDADKYETELENQKAGTLFDEIMPNTSRTRSGTGVTGVETQEAKIRAILESQRKLDEIFNNARRNSF